MNSRESSAGFLIGGAREGIASRWLLCHKCWSRLILSDALTVTPAVEDTRARTLPAAVVVVRGPEPRPLRALPCKRAVR